MIEEDSWRSNGLLRNEHLQVEVDADTLKASVLHLASGLRWQFGAHETGRGTCEPRYR